MAFQSRIVHGKNALLQDSRTTRYSITIKLVTIGFAPASLNLYTANPSTHFLIGHMKNWFIVYLDIFRAFSNFDGRSTRLEIWNFLINNIVIGAILIFLIGPFAWIFNVAVFIASIGLTVRRFHDEHGVSDEFTAVGVPFHHRQIGPAVPILNLLFFAMLYFFKSDPGTNKYGPNPYGI